MSALSSTPAPLGAPISANVAQGTQAPAATATESEAEVENRANAILYDGRRPGESSIQDAIANAANDFVARGYYPTTAVAERFIRQVHIAFVQRWEAGGVRAAYSQCRLTGIVRARGAIYALLTQRDAASGEGRTQAISNLAERLNFLDLGGIGNPATLSRADFFRLANAEISRRMRSAPDGLMTYLNSLNNPAPARVATPAPNASASDASSAAAAAPALVAAPSAPPATPNYDELTIVISADDDSDTEAEVVVIPGSYCE